MALKLIKNLYGSSPERRFAQLYRKVAGIVFLNAALSDAWRVGARSTEVRVPLTWTS